ncbi:MAG TPA: SRPBCC family protein [Steroidobacteraceae bacterium]|nr:SRPBCC family protein [Steroidobacteraceae bacterium]
MASIYRDIIIEKSANSAWEALRRYDAAAQLFAGVLVECRCTGNVREVTFANGAKITEHLVTCDDSRRRLVYTVRHEAYAHHSASMQIVPDPAGCRFIWVSDFLPDELSAKVGPLMDAGCQALKNHLERSPTG